MRRDAMLMGAVLAGLSGILLAPDKGDGGGGGGELPAETPETETPDTPETPETAETEAPETPEPADTVPAAEKPDDTVAGAGADDTVAAGAGEDTTAGGAGDDTVASGEGEDKPDADAEKQLTQRREYLTKLGKRYDALNEKVQAGKFDPVDDGVEAFKVLNEVIQVQAERLHQLEQQETARQQETAAKTYWETGYVKQYPDVPVAEGQSLWKDVQAWAKLNKRSPEQAVARWETLMESKVSAAKAAKKPDPKPAPKPQVRPTGTPAPKVEDAPAPGGETPIRGASGMLKRLGWG